MWFMSLSFVFFLAAFVLSLIFCLFPSLLPSLLRKVLDAGSLLFLTLAYQKIIPAYSLQCGFLHIYGKIKRIKTLLLLEGY